MRLKPIVGSILEQKGCIINLRVVVCKGSWVTGKLKCQLRSENFEIISVSPKFFRVSNSGSFLLFRPCGFNSYLCFFLSKVLDSLFIAKAHVEVQPESRCTFRLSSMLSVRNWW